MHPTVVLIMKRLKPPLFTTLLLLTVSMTLLMRQLCLLFPKYTITPQINLFTQNIQKFYNIILKCIYHL